VKPTNRITPPTYNQQMVTTSSWSHQAASYANVTLSSGPLSAIVFLPDGIKPDERTYYTSSRFDWSSNIGAVSRVGVDGKTHVLFGTEMWRQPHDPTNTEAGVGLASEFGVGDDGSFCNFQCGWQKDDEVTNGVLGYDTAGVGESFLKIGVGALIKGSCPDCDPTSVYKFNSEYKFDRPPVWTLTQQDDGKSLRLSNEETLREFGYRLYKDVTLNDDQLLITTTLTNIGRVPMSTAWYSHNFFACDNTPVGPGYSVDLDLPSGGDFTEPGFMIWSSPIRDYAKISRRTDDQSRKKVMKVELQRPVEQNVKLKAEFFRDDASRGGFTLHGCHTNIHETIPEAGSPGGPTLYAYNLYAERETLSPEVQLFLHLSPGETKSWTQKLDFSDDVPSFPSSSLLRSISAGGRRGGMISTTIQLHPFMTFVLTVALTAGVLALLLHRWRRSTNHNLRSLYDPI
jgi:hypothetical protein